MDESIVELQSRLAIQEDALEQLNQVVADQQRRIERLQEELERLTQQVRTLMPSPAGDARSEPPPPHY